MKKLIVLLAACMASSMLFANHWVSENPGNYSLVMALNGVIQINGAEQVSDQLEVGAFCNGECRGSQMASVFPFTGRYIIMLSIDGENGDQITFKLYDHSVGQELSLTSPNAVIFNNDGLGNYFEPYVLNFTGDDTQTFTLPITGYGNSAGGYSLIAPPFDDINPAEIEGMTEGDYDLYYFDESLAGEEWRNYEAGAFHLESGRGYLYAHKTDVTLSFTGVPYNGDGQVTLSKTEGKPFAGWNLVGNPFAQTASIDRDCYVMNEAGTEIIASDTRNVSPMQGVFVIAAEDGETMTFVPQSTTDQDAKVVLNVSRNRAGVFDRAIVRFGGNGTLPKFMLNPGNTKLYIPLEGTDYAVVTSDMDNATPVSFKARENGTYTLSADIVNLELEYLHLIDNKTGDDIDLLQTPSYTFQAYTTDYAERFMLVYASSSICGDANGDNAAFAFVSDGNIIVVGAEAGAVLQMVDATGRVLFCRDASNASAISTTGMAPGGYILRLVNGDDVKVQKIVVR